MTDGWRACETDPMPKTSDLHTVQAVERALDLLEYLAASGGEAALADISHATNLPYGTAHRLLRTLALRGYVRQHDSRRYCLAAGLVKLGDAAGRALGFGVAQYLEQLVILTGESASLAIMEGTSVVYVAQTPSPHRLRTFAEVGRRVLPHCTGVGKVLLAARGPQEAERIVKITGMPARTANTITELDRLHEELQAIRDRGYALDNGEEEIGVHCIAVPVVCGEAVIGAMSISGPTERVDALDREQVVAAMKAVAAEFAATSFAQSPSDE